jgi:catalase
MTETPDLIGKDAPLTGARALARYALIGAVLLAVLAAFAYTGGWLSPARVTQSRLMVAFDAANGAHPGFRRNHAKGVCVTGWFESNGNAAALSTATVFAAGRVPLVGRFALAGGMPFLTDAPGAVRSMALRLLPPGGGEWRTGMNSIPVFAVNSAQGFYDQLVASKPDPATGKPDPAAMQEFLTRHPETVRAVALIKAHAMSSGFADATFNSLNAFRMVNAAGVSTPVRWAAVPIQESAARSSQSDEQTHEQTKGESETPHAAADKNYLFHDLIARIQRQPLQWHLVITVGEPGDPTSDATIAWPEERRHVDAGLVSIDHVFSEDSSSGSCTDINYDPLVLPTGIEPSDDPLLSARSAAYARSFTLRAGEKRKKIASALTEQDVAAGGTR